MHNPRLYYRLSGKFSPVAPALALMAMGAAAVLGAVYALVSYYLPFVYINFLLAIGCGVVVGFAGHWAMRAGKVRNGLFALVSGVLNGVVALFVSWSIWILALSGWEALVITPAALFSIVKLLAAEGVWSAFGGTPTGWVLYAIWGVEALILVGGAALVTCGACLQSPFCERCDRWITHMLPAPTFEKNINAQDCVTQLEGGNFDYLKGFVPTRPGVEGDGYVKLELLQCPTCQSHHFLNIKVVDISVDNRNQKQTKQTEVLQHLILDAAAFEKVRQFLESHDRARSALPPGIPPFAAAA